MSSVPDVPEDPGQAMVEAWIAERTAGQAADVVRLSGDASTRRYFRVLSRATSSIVVLYPEPFESRSLPFLEVGTLLSRWGLPVPAVLSVDGGRGLVEVEDLGDVLLQDRVNGASKGEIHAHYREALVDLVTLQRASLAGPRDGACFGLAFDKAKLTWELDFFVEHFLEGQRGARLESSEVEELRVAFGLLCWEIAGWPRVLCHRDFHSRNLMCHQDRLYWIDFQDARLGPAHYDLASLLRDSYVDLDEEMVEDLLEEFRQRAFPDESPAEFVRRFDLVSVQRNLKALGTFGYMATVRGARLYLDFVPRTLARVRRNLLRHPELAVIGRVLARHVPELVTVT